MTDAIPSSLRQLARDLAIDIGRQALHRRHAGPFAISEKASPTDMVTEVDRWAETEIVAAITAARPGDSIMGEEGTAVRGDSGVEWFIDPIDGTTNFVFDIPEWCVSIGAAIDGQMVAGAVSVPMLDEIYCAHRGGGAARNGVPISARTQPGLATALIATGFGYLADRRRQQAEVLVRLLPQVRDIRRSGSAAYDLCAVACGRLDAYYEIGINAWDVAAGEIIASEAGARVTGLTHPTARQGSVLAVADVLYDDVRRAIDAAGGGWPSPSDRPGS